jgi:hypothetical protein
LVIGLTEHLENVITNNYDILIELHLPEIIVTSSNTKSYQSSEAVAVAASMVHVPLLRIAELSSARAISLSLLTA